MAEFCAFKGVVRRYFFKEELKINLEDDVCNRYKMEDFSGALLAEAEAERQKMPSFVPPYMFNSRGQPVSAFNGVGY